MILMKVFVMLLAQTSISMKLVQNLFLFVFNRSILNYFSQKKYNNKQEDIYGITNNLIKKLQSHVPFTSPHPTPPHPQYTTPPIPSLFWLLSLFWIVALCILHVSFQRFSLKMNFIWGCDKNDLLWKRNEIIHAH